MTDEAENAQLLAEYQALRRVYGKGLTQISYSTGPGQTKTVTFASTRDLERRMQRLGEELGLLPKSSGIALAVFVRDR